MRKTPVAEALRIGQLLLLTFVAFTATRAVLPDAAASAAAAAEARGERAATAARGGLSRAAASAPETLRVRAAGAAIVDGVAAAAREAAPAELEAPRGMAFAEVRAQEEIPYEVRVVRDPALPAGRSVQVTAGVPGLLETRYRIRSLDGDELTRAILGQEVLRGAVAEVRRVGTLVPAAPADVEAIIRAAAARWGADPEQMLRVAWCESRFDPFAYNPRHGDSGLFQFIPSTWAANSVRAGYAGASPFDAVANANVAAYMFARGQASAWVCK